VGSAHPTALFTPILHLVSYALENFQDEFNFLSSGLSPPLAPPLLPVGVRTI